MTTTTTTAEIRATEAPADPTIVRLTTEVMPNGKRYSSYKITGAPTNPKWIHRAGANPWCEVSTWGVGENRKLGSFGGELWPAAWHLTEIIEGLRRDIVLTDRGRALFDAADARADAKGNA